MNLSVLSVSVLSLALAANLAAQADMPMQVHYAANLAAADSVVNITNTGASGGNICVNIYTFSPDEQLVSCCSCVVTPNALVSLSVRQDLISNTMTPAVPSSLVVKLLATTGGACNAAVPGALANGMAAWGTTVHWDSSVPDNFVRAGYRINENAFTPVTPGAAEIARISAVCGFIQSNGSGYGICRSCRAGALGASAK